MSRINGKDLKSLKAFIEGKKGLRQNTDYAVEGFFV